MKDRLLNSFRVALGMVAVVWGGLWAIAVLLELLLNGAVQLRLPLGSWEKFLEVLGLAVGIQTLLLFIFVPSRVWQGKPSSSPKPANAQPRSALGEAPQWAEYLLYAVIILLLGYLARQFIDECGPLLAPYMFRSLAEREAACLP